MKRLLIHALRSEAGLIRQRYPGATTPECRGGIELRSLDSENDLLRTGMGLAKTEAVMVQVPGLEQYDQFIHFGVSGSLADDLAPYTLILGHEFMARDEPILNPSMPLEDWSLSVRQVSFYSSNKVVEKEEVRELLQKQGAHAVDMESYAVIKHLLPYNTPVTALRCISDRAGATTAQEFKTQYTLAAKLLQETILQHILKK